MGFEGERRGLIGRMRAVFGGKRGTYRIVSCWVFFFSSVAPVTIRWLALCSG
jgi:hypothetical protein